MVTFMIEESKSQSEESKIQVQETAKEVEIEPEIEKVPVELGRKVKLNIDPEEINKTRTWQIRAYWARLVLNIMIVVYIYSKDKWNKNVAVLWNSENYENDCYY